jgi:hypothetical protein
VPTATHAMPPQRATLVGIATGTHVMPYGGPSARDLEGHGNEWDRQVYQVYLLYWYKSNCFTGTKVLAGASSEGHRSEWDLAVLSLLALLVPKVQIMTPEELPERVLAGV